MIAHFDPNTITYKEPTISLELTSLEMNYLQDKYSMYTAKTTTLETTNK